MTMRAINTEAVIALVNTLADEVEAVLNLGPDPAALEAVTQLADRLFEVSDALAHAATANDIVARLQRRLMRRAYALAEVHNQPEDLLEQTGGLVARVPDYYFGARFGTDPRTAPPCQDDNPFADTDSPF